LLTRILTAGSACISDTPESHTAHIARYNSEVRHGTLRTDEPLERAARTLHVRIHVAPASIVPSPGPALVSPAELVGRDPCLGQRDTELDRLVCSRPKPRSDTGAIWYRRCNRTPHRSDS
jgi:hypothetical protein